MNSSPRLPPRHSGALSLPSGPLGRQAAFSMSFSYPNIKDLQAIIQISAPSTPSSLPLVLPSQHPPSEILIFLELIRNPIPKQEHFQSTSSPILLLTHIPNSSAPIPHRPIHTRTLHTSSSHLPFLVRRLDLLSGHALLQLPSSPTDRPHPRSHSPAFKPQPGPAALLSRPPTSLSIPSNPTTAPSRRSIASGCGRRNPP